MPLDEVPLMAAGDLRIWFANWYQASRPAFFVATLVPLVLGTVLAAREQPVSWTLFSVVIFSSFLVHLSTNLANDLFDHLAGADDGISIGGSRVIQQGRISPRQIAFALFLLYGLAALGGLCILLATQLWWLAGYMLVAFCSSLFYTAPPLRLGYHGLGEVTVFLNMGPLMVTGAYAVQAGTVNWDVLLLSLPTGIMVAMILFFQSLPDMQTDRASGKRTIAVSLGRETSIKLFFILGAAAILAIQVLLYMHLLSLIALLSICTLPLLQHVVELLKATPDWQAVHDRGKRVRLFYLLNGIVMILAACFLQ